MSSAIAGHIGRYPDTVREAVETALRDLAIAHKRSAEETLRSLEIYERVVAGLSPEAIIRGGNRALEEERFFPSPAVFRGLCVEEHGRIMRARDAVVGVRRQVDDRSCEVCGAAPYERNRRWIMDHNPVAHGVYRPALV